MSVARTRCPKGNVIDWGMDNRELGHANHCAACIIIACVIVIGLKDSLIISFAKDLR